MSFYRYYGENSLLIFNVFQFRIKMPILGGKFVWNLFFSLQILDWDSKFIRKIPNIFPFNLE